MDKQKDPVHLTLESNEENVQDFYTFDNEPHAIWVHDQPVQEAN